MLKNKNIAFIGAGSMAEAMISGIISSKMVPAAQIIACNKSNIERRAFLEEKYGIQTSSLEQLNYSEIDLFILAMKPKDAAESLLNLKDKVQPHQIVSSVLAGISTSFMEEHLSQNQPVIRIMPNTSSMVEESATALTAGKHTKMDDVLEVKELLESMGEVFIIEENKMDIFTGIAGSGPAYFYYLMEHMEKAGKEEGLESKVARKIIAQTLLGAAKMIMENEEGPSELRENVTSPNGTTAAGLAALMDNGGGNAIAQAVNSASKRSKEISDELKKVLVTS
ncbi:pyrroline-5-carboxylate reductase [Fictibacillus aquaticus]|uniref:Pyrroline-5-carboxylate reductase n=1 Tax=Fictibacillus aquaticus TaxID=2021314 RepID=A0A235FES0_9BACL|nr:pyrroline-5-carboxylate reductase [Fictibacillus aquaticus]OYD59265.1 pyrroline-5-carboxylate reductase [Fictibacillus aquaticus]